MWNWKNIFRYYPCGVPQASILGPLFFIVFINDMYLYPDLEDISLFADDATAHHSSKCTQIITQKLQNVATSANKWCEDNKMQLSIIKTKVALVGSKQRINRITDSDKQIKIIINDIPIEQVSHSKLLGIHIDESLTWNLQVTKVKKQWLINYFFSNVYDPSCQPKVELCFLTTI